MHILCRRVIIGKHSYLETQLSVTTLCLNIKSSRGMRGLQETRSHARISKKGDKNHITEEFWAFLLVLSTIIFGEQYKLWGSQRTLSWGSQQTLRGHRNKMTTCIWQWPWLLAWYHSPIYKYYIYIYMLFCSCILLFLCLWSILSLYRIYA